jgi:hypothetical protein
MRGKRDDRSFFGRHSLTLVVLAIWLAWLILYHFSDPKTHVGAFFGNATADWLGMLAFVVMSKYFIEVGSDESRTAQPQAGGRLRQALARHSLSLIVVGTGLVWLIVFARADPTGKAGQVYGNVVSEWGQLLGLIVMTKYFREEGSKED